LLDGFHSFRDDLHAEVAADFYGLLDHDAVSVRDVHLLNGQA
jgi:hypothetical protein